MIHATIHGALVDDAEYWDASRDRARGRPRQARAEFTIETTRREGTPQLVACRICGSRATSIEPHLVAGKRVVVSGELRLPNGAGPARLYVDICQLVGGTRTVDHDEDAEHAEEIER